VLLREQRESVAAQIPKSSGEGDSSSRPHRKRATALAFDFLVQVLDMAFWRGAIGSCEVLSQKFG
jgi:hypothetical protein